jgi:UDP-2,3-diacylglucosamine pyrophosphatase LpxH
MGLLDQLGAALGEVGRTEVVASYASPQLGIPAPNDIRIFIPDLHLVSDETRRGLLGLGPGPSHSLLKRVLGRLAAFRRDTKLADQAAVCALYFMGDFLDLWREETPDTSPAEAAHRIARDHQELMALARAPELKARFLLGNHDFALCRLPRFLACDRRYFFPPRTPSTLCLHGDVFDWLEDLPDSLSQLLVYYTSPVESLLDHAWELVAGLLEQFNQERLGAGSDEPRGDEPVPVHRCTSSGEARTHHRLWHRAWEARQKLREDVHFGIRSIVVAHTHRARIVTCEADSDFLALIDTGAWIEDLHEDGGAESGLVTALSGNEVRIHRIVNTG